jgi:hypothetical protein
MRITRGGKSHDATGVKLWDEVYFLDEMEDQSGGRETPAMVSGRYRALVFLGLASFGSMIEQRIPGRGVFSGH